MTKPVKVILVSVAVIALLLATAMALLDSEWAKGFLEDQVSQRLEGREVIIGDLDIEWGFPLGIQMKNVSIANPDWAEHERMLELAAMEATIKTGQLLRGRIGLGRLDLQQPVVHLERREDGTSNWQALQSEEDSDEPPVIPDSVNLSDGVLTYRDATLDADLRAEFETRGEAAGDHRLDISLQGRYQGRPVQLNAEGGAPSRALQENTDYSVALQGQLGELRISFDGTAGDLLQFEDLQGTLQASAPAGADVTAMLGQPDLSIPAFNLEAQVSHGEQAWSLSELRAQVGESHLAGSLSVDPGPPSVEMDLQLERVDLGELLEPQGYPQLGVVTGELDGGFSDGILTINDSNLSYDAPDQQLHLQLNAQSRDVAASEQPGAHLEGTGSRNGQPFNFDLEVGPLLDLTASEQPYPIKGTLVSQETRLDIDGTIVQPLELGAIDVQVHLSGPGPASLNRLTGFDLPGLPAYELEGRFRWDDQLSRLNELQVRLGESDFSGDVRLQRGDRRMLYATLHSTRLDIEDLEPLWVKTEIEEDEPESDKIFSDDPFNLEPLQNMDARVRYQADTLNSPSVPLNDVSLELELDQGVITVEPLQVGVGGGEITGRLELDAANLPLEGELDLSIKRVTMSALLRRADLRDVAEDSAGVIGGRTDLGFQGNSMDELMASLDGLVEAAISGGELDRLAVEILGLDVGEALMVALINTDQGPVSMRCAYARLDAEQGIAEIEQFFVSTADTNFTGAGTINLDAEQLDVVLEAHAKDLSLLSLDSPVQVAGPFSNLQVSVVSTGLLARGVATVLGAIVAPPLAILPWVELGLGEDAGPGCRQALQEFESQGQG
ncbi:AsmA family protein [Pseudomonas sp. OIL-1]|uniref:AsmA family protein n=1 Tax=Pseudomonas sp. OIL-1 TaxID=2706126 RepID=UPI0013A789FB|nr:AsmA family protein [Pseudomonas sp. OIL-1]QIB50007.1 AsmA family protein [Pseudomonas sp. OIL-1]